MSYTQVEELRELQGINNSRDIKARFDRSYVQPTLRKHVKKIMKGILFMIIMLLLLCYGTSLF